jgi:predicted XRE-type DNA-binding protein
MTKSEQVTTGSGNIFIDLGFDEQQAEELLLKSHLFHSLQDAIRHSKMTQVEVARLLGTDQSKVSLILRGKIADFSMDRITSYLLRLGWDLLIEVRRAPRKSVRGRAVLNAPNAPKKSRRSTGAKVPTKKRA